MHDQEMCRLEALRAEMGDLTAEQMRFLRRLAREHAAAGLPVPAYAEQLLADHERGRPEWAHRPIPEVVVRMHPGVEGWEWVSPRALRAPHSVRGCWWVVVVSDDHQAAHGGTAPDAALRERLAELYLSLGRELATRNACHDGAPVRADHDQTLCRWCGVAADDHEVPGDSGDPAPYQDWHRAWPGQPPQTLAETDAELTIALEAMRFRARGSAP